MSDRTVVGCHTALMYSNGAEVVRDDTDEGCEAANENHQNMTCQQKHCKPDQNRCQYVHHKWPEITEFVLRPKELC